MKKLDSKCCGFVIKNLWATTKHNFLSEKNLKYWPKITGISNDANRRRYVRCSLKMKKLCFISILPFIVHTKSNFQWSSQSTYEEIIMGRTFDFDLRRFRKIVLFIFMLRLHTDSILDHVTISQDVAESLKKCADCIEITFKFYESASSV